MVSLDNKVYIIKLCSGFIFSDGLLLMVEDVVFILMVLFDFSYDGDIDIILVNIVGGVDYKVGKVDSVSGLKVIDLFILQVIIMQSGVIMLVKIGGFVLLKVWYGKGYQWGNFDYLCLLYGKLLGNGFYVYDKYIFGQEICFYVNSYFYCGMLLMLCFIYCVINLFINFQLFQIGEIDYDVFILCFDDIE